MNSTTSDSRINPAPLTVDRQIVAGQPAKSTGQPVSFELAIYRIVQQERWKWSAAWFRIFELIAQAPSINTPTHARGFTNSIDFCPRDVEALGCRGINSSGTLAWIFFDLDVGHGRIAYDSTEAALSDAHRIRDVFNGEAEIRLSKSGVGVHVCHLARTGDMPAEEGPRIAKAITKKLNLKADPSALGRQCRWLWCRCPGPDSFKLIAAHEGITVHG